MNSVIISLVLRILASQNRFKSLYNKHDSFRVFFPEKSLSEVFGRIKFHKKESRNIFKLSRLRCQFCSAVLVIDTFTTNWLFFFFFLIPTKKFTKKEARTVIQNPKI